MNKIQVFTITSLFLLVLVISCKSQKKVDGATVLHNIGDSVSYAIGVQLGTSFLQQGLDTSLNVDVLVQGLKQSLSKTSVMSIEKTDPIIKRFFDMQRQAQSGDKIKEGEAFLKENGKRKEVVTTSSGLQYEILVAGKGEKPKISNTVKTHYKGTLLNGTVFDSSYDRGEPLSFPLNGVIKGWTEALQLMPVGSKWKLYIPYNLAYGESGAGQSIGPYETLIFEVELLEIVK